MLLFAFACYVTRGVEHVANDNHPTGPQWMLSCFAERVPSMQASVAQDCASRSRSNPAPTVRHKPVLSQACARLLQDPSEVEEIAARKSRMLRSSANHASATETEQTSQDSKANSNSHHVCKHPCPCQFGSISISLEHGQAFLPDFFIAALPFAVQGDQFGPFDAFDTPSSSSSAAARSSSSRVGFLSSSSSSSRSTTLS